MTRANPACAIAAMLAFAAIGVPDIALAQLATVTVHIAGARPASGTAEISLFNSAESFMQEPFLQMSEPVSAEGEATAEFAGVPSGAYAIVVVHDENDNGKLDAGFFGIGGESYAWFKDAHPLFGWPDFENVKFEVSADMEIEIRLD